MSEQKPYFENLDQLGDLAQLLSLKGTNIKENQDAALKLMDYTNEKPKNYINSIKKEYELLQKLSQNEYLVKGFDCFIGNYTEGEEEEIEQDNQNKENKENLFLVLEKKNAMHKIKISTKI
ncbi:hypothetical protein ABPG72_020835 [Tetrahymena utriculariae]